MNKDNRQNTKFKNGFEKYHYVTKYQRAVVPEIYKK
jgi:hypothetical protein